jgi:hypothetical protein
MNENVEDFSCLFSMRNSMVQPMAPYGYQLYDQANQEPRLQIESHTLLPYTPPRPVPIDPEYKDMGINPCLQKTTKPSAARLPAHINRYL